MFKFRGDAEIDVMVQICDQSRNPYEAVESVFINSAYPLKDHDRIDFITENLQELDILCEFLHAEYLIGNQSLVKVPTHNAPSTLH